MKRFLNFSYGGHIFISKNRRVTFFKNIKTEEKAREYGMKKYSDPRFVGNLVNICKKVDEELKNIKENIKKSNLSNLSDKELRGLFLEFFDKYSNLTGVYRFLRPDFMRNYQVPK